MSILGTCPECLHHTDGMCDLRQRICLNYDHFERRPMVTLTRDDFEKLYISRAAYDELNAKVAALRAELDAANALVREQDVIYMGHYQTVQEIREATEELFAFIEAHADKAFLAHATTLIDFRARIMPKNFPNTAAIASHEARKGGEK